MKAHRRVLGSVIPWFCAALGVACGATEGGAPNGGSGGAGPVPVGGRCLLPQDCQSRVCNAGICATPSTGMGGAGSAGSSGSNAGATSSSAGNTGTFVGSGTGYRPLTTGCGPSTANQCTGQCEQSGGEPTTVLRPPAKLCFASEDDPTPNDPMATIEQVVEEINGQKMVHLRVTFDPHFVDNTYGSNACCGWTPATTSTGSGGTAGAMPGKGMMPGKTKGGHTFDDLVGSDHVELLLTNGTGATIMEFDLDYITASTTVGTCGYTALGVSGGEGKMITGNASAILASTTSLNRNLNGCGYCYTTDSPATDENFTPNAATPNWDYRVVYEVWVALDAFGSAGFGQAYMESVHASPSKLASNTVEVTATPCPPTWDTPYCPPSAQGQGMCSNEEMPCEPNWTLYLATEGVQACVPIPFSNWPNRGACPDGYVLDTATEGKYCVKK